MVKKTVVDADDIIGVAEDSVTMKIWQLVPPVCEAEGLELIQVEFRSESGGKVLRLYLDSPGGVKLDDCARISRQVDDLLAVYLEEERDYTLEVSSAGLERPLARRQDFRRFTGYPVRVRMQEPIAGRKNFKGKLLGFSEESVRLQVEEKEVFLPFQGIKKAQLVANNNGANG